MEDFSQFLMGSPTKANPQANPVVAQGNQKPSSSWSEQEIDRLINTESSKNPYAINKETKAIGVGQFTPETLAMLHKQGIKFDPFDPEQSRGAIRTYLDKLTTQTGSKEGALKAYGGFVTKDPSGYISKILVPGQSSEQTTSQPTDEFQSFLSGAKPIKEEEPKTRTQVLKQFGSDVMKPLNEMSWENFKKESLLPKIATGMAGTGEEKKQLAEDIYKGSEKFVSGVQEFAKHPWESIKNVGSELIEHPGKFVGEAIKGTIYDPELALLPGGTAVKQGEKLAVRAGEAISPAAKGMTEQFAAKQPVMAGVGAAESNLVNRVQTALNEAPDYLKQSLKDVPVEKLATPENLKAIENHNKFAKFDLTPTEGQALENTSLMSSEFNSRKIDPNLQARFEERDPKLIQGFNNIKEKASPDVFENDPARLASMPLDRVKDIHQQKEINASNLWREANLASGSSQSPIDVGALRENIINGLKEKQRTRYVPEALKADLDEVLAQGYMTPEQYENFRTDTATISRKNPDPMARQAAAIIRQKLEQVPIKDEFAQYKPLYDAARKATADLHSFEKSSLVKAAISDTRTAEEIAAGMPHPAAKNFMSQHYSAKTPQVEIERMLDLIGRNSPEHQALNKLKIDEFKLNSGIINDKGTISQTALNKQVREQHKTNLTSMFGQELSKDLEDLADVAHLTEPRKGVHSVNVSNTEILRQENAAKAAKEAAGNIVAGGAEAIANAKIPFSGTIIRKTLGGYKAEKEAKAATKAAQEESERRLSPKAGIKLKDIGKE